LWANCATQYPNDRTLPDPPPAQVQAQPAAGAAAGQETTLRSSLEPDRSLNLAHPATFREFVARPERLEQELAAAPEVRTVLLDEVQRVPALLDVVQILLDREPDRRRFLLSGSIARKLRDAWATRAAPSTGTGAR
jgi:hypothetical protein